MHEATPSVLPSPTAAMPQQPPARRGSAPLLYAVLAALLVIAVAYQVRVVEQIFPQWFGAKVVNWPFLLYSEDQPRFLIHYVFGEARTAGLRDGDILVAINGIPVTSRSIYDDSLLRSRPGDSMDVTFRESGEQFDRHARLRLSNLEANPILINSDSIKVLFYVAMPAFCLALGFWIVVLRPYDLRAWLLLGLLLSMATFFNAFPEFWSPPFRTLGAIYLNFQEYSLFGWLLLLGIYFPEPFPKTLRWKWWKWLAWTVLPLWAVLAGAYIVDLVIQLHSLTAALPLDRFLGQTLGSRPGQILPLLMILGFLACLAAKYRTASSADAKRRLRVLYAGAAFSLLPIAALITIGNLKGTNDAPFPVWLKVMVFLAFFLFPVTLAYVIVVQRALDVRVVLRQGLQYTLARRGVLILQILLSSALFIALTILMTSHAMNPLGTVAALAVGFWGIFLLHGATQRLAVWVDRRFFRDAYDAEQILNDLAEKVRTIVETNALLETVAQRIADSLHVKQIAVLLDRDGLYSPAHLMGFDMVPELAFSANAATVQVLKTEKQPTRVYFDDPASWIYKTSEQGSAMDNDERNQLLALRSELLLPFSAKDDLIGFISLGQKLSEAPYSGTDLRLLNSVATQTGLALEVARLTTAISHELALRERLNRELEIACEVQQHLFPQHLPAISGLDYCALCHPAREVGGDYYDFLELPAGKFGVAIGDVSGKGIGASLMMASLVASLRSQAAIAPNLTELIERVNGLLYGASSVNRYATFFYAEYDPSSRHICYVNAGHNPPVVLRCPLPGSLQLFRLEAGGPPVGLLPSARYEQVTFTLEPGDILLLFTDGISESMNSSDEEWGEERLIGLAKTCDSLPASAIIERIMTAAHAFANGAPQHDDMTVVALRVLAGAHNAAEKFPEVTSLLPSAPHPISLQ